MELNRQDVGGSRRRPKSASATFFVDQVRFSDTLMWQRGQMLRRDADNPYKVSFISDRR